MDSQPFSLERRLRVASALYCAVRAWDEQGGLGQPAKRWIRGVGTIKWVVLSQGRFTAHLAAELQWDLRYMVDVKFDLHVYHDLQVAELGRYNAPQYCDTDANVGQKQEFSLLLLEWLRQSLPARPSC